MVLSPGLHVVDVSFADKALSSVENISNRSNRFGLRCCVSLLYRSFRVSLLMATANRPVRFPWNHLPAAQPLLRSTLTSQTQSELDSQRSSFGFASLSETPLGAWVHPAVTGSGCLLNPLSGMTVSTASPTVVCELTELSVKH